MTGPKTAGTLYSEGFAVLKRNYWKFVLISAIILCAGIVTDYLLQYAAVPVVFMMEFVLIGMSNLIAGTAASHYRYGSYYNDFPMDGSVAAAIWVLVFFVAAILLFVAVLCCIRMILTGTAEMGAKDAAVTMAEGGKPSFDATLGKFGRRFWRYLGVNAWIALWTALWGMLFIVPGIYKFYCYRMAPYLVLQYPDLTVRQALRRSIEITRGYKGTLFALDMIRLAFAAGAVLASCCLIFLPVVLAALLWLMPLGYALFAVAWLDIRQAAIGRGLLPPSGPSDPPARPTGEEAQPLPAHEISHGGGEFAGLEDDSPEL